jgi:hypothetical protein
MVRCGTVKSSSVKKITLFPTSTDTDLINYILLEKADFTDS